MVQINKDCNISNANHWLGAQQRRHDLLSLCRRTAYTAGTSDPFVSVTLELNGTVCIFWPW